MAVVMMSRANGLLVARRFEELWALCDENTSTGEAAEGSGGHGFRAALCAVGVQALAEMDRWAEVLPWLLAQYGSAEKLPAQVLQLCILLMSQIGKPELVLDTAQAWLQEHAAARHAVPDASRATAAHKPVVAGQAEDGSCLVAELHLQHVLLPLRRWGEADRLLSSMADVWESWRGDRAQALLQEERERAASIPTQEPCVQQPQPPSGYSNGDGAITSRPESKPWGRVCRTLLAVMSVAGAPIRRVALFLFLLSVLLFQIDPASPAALRPTSALVRLLLRVWRAVVGRLYSTH